MSRTRSFRFPFQRNGMGPTHLQAFMAANEMVVGSPPFEMIGKIFWKLGQAPGAPGEFGDAPPQGEIDLLHKGSIDATRKPDPYKSFGEGICLPTDHLPLYPDQLSAASVFDHPRIKSPRKTRWVSSSLQQVPNSQHESRADQGSIYSPSGGNILA